MTAGCVGIIGGTIQPLVGCSSRRIAALGRGHLDGIRSDTGNTLRGTVTSSNYISLTDSTANFSAAAVGFPVQIVEGTGRGQCRIVSARTATKLTVDAPWKTVPDTTSVYQLGGIRWKYRSGWFRFNQTGSSETQGFELMYRPTAGDTHMAVRRYFDNSETPTTEKENRSYTKANGLKITSGDTDILIQTTKSSGLVKHDSDTYRAPDVDGVRYVRIEWEGVPNYDGHAIRNVILHGTLQGGGG